MPVKRWYPSKIDWWLGLVLCLAPITSIAALIGTLVSGVGLLATGVGCLLLAAIYLGLVFPMRYGIDDEHVVIRHGLIRQRISLRDITEVAPSRSLVGSPALSLDRLEIKFGDGFFRSTMISPSSKADFLTELAAHADLQRIGDRLVR